VYLSIFHFFRQRDYLIRKVMIVGYNDMSKKLVQRLEEDPIPTRVIGYCENENSVHELSNYPILGGLNNIIEVSKLHKATDIFSTIAPEHDKAIYQLMEEADQACIRFKLIPNFESLINKPVYIDYIHGMPVLNLRKDPLEDVANRIKKRFFDVIISSLVIVGILSWMIPLIGLLIWIESPGPIFFFQRRSGRDNHPFSCIKFRSMRINKDAHLRQAQKSDARITRIGKFLRRTSLDEFPQFLNVFLGHMSIVGPRPHMLKHTDDYSVLINKYMVRQFLKPGITGWAQINGFRGETRTVEQMEGRVQHDIWYLENWSLWLDMRIMFLTAYNVVKGEDNAY
jgi:putative colanic acid biosynthesis UDP-glucose lipid carrier transferase